MHTLDLVHQGWLRVSNPQLKNLNKYSKLRLPDWQEHEIPTGRDYFRKNKAYTGSKSENDPPTDEYFYARLSKRNFWYTVSKDSVHAAGAMSVHEFKTAISLEDYARDPNCFEIKDRKQLNWTLCAQNAAKRNKWVCKIKELLGQSDYSTCVKTIISSDIPTVVKKVFQPVIMLPVASPMCNENYNYDAHGTNWECDCHDGKEQAPIDLPLPEKSTLSPVKPMFQYYDVDFQQVKTTTDGAVKIHENIKIKLDTGSLRIKYENLGELVTIDGSVYRAQEIVFRTPAEHTINGKRYDMEMQVIHYGQTSGDIAKQAILCFVFEKKPGVYNKFIDDIDFFNLPNALHPEINLGNNIYIPKIFYNSEVEDAPIMKDFSFYTYQGSLTEPPCTERTIMYVAATPIKLGTTAIQLFQEALRYPDLMSTKGDIIKSTRLPVNNRKTQERNGRQVYFYPAKEDCVSTKKGKPVHIGHYEKIPMHVTKYYFIGGPEPSGMPGAMVVSKHEANYGQDLLNLVN